MTDIASLKDSIEQYETQLTQVQVALLNTPAGPDRDNLLSLQSDIQELIALTKASLQSAEGKEISDNEDDGLSDDDDNDDDNDDPMSKEYAMFKAELEEDELRRSTEEGSRGEDASNNDDDNNIEEELKALEGLKCRAPYGSSWGGTGYHNAMVSSIVKHDQCSINSINDIQVRVLFINPTHKEMLPCAYYLNGQCKFSDEKCHYSHGEIVPFSSLQEYREPNYSSIKMGSRVLAKENSKIWHRSVVLKIPEGDTNDQLYRVKFEASGNIIEVALYDLLPLEDDQLDMSDSSDDDDDYENDAAATTDNDDYGGSKNESTEKIIHKSLLTLNSNEPLGKWEEYTRGIGSRLMAQMGYISGTGLGKRSDGRIVPVEATVLPPGKSLDHCMELKENAKFGDKDLFSVQRKLRKQNQKLQKQLEKQYDKEKNRGNNIFDFINTTLLSTDKQADGSSQAGGSSKRTNDLKTQTNRSLNVASFKIDENITKLEKESTVLENSLKKHTKGSIPYNNIIMQYNDKQMELVNLRSQQKSIACEQIHRKDKTKLSIF